MTSQAQNLRAFLDASPAVALVEVREAAGSTPREVGAWMLVSLAGIFGTIGGGQLEFMAIDRAREMLGGTPTSPSPRSRGEGKGEGRALALEDGASNADAGAAPHPPFGHLLPVNGEKEKMVALLDIPLGPEIGQCCGGRVKIDIALVDEELREAIPQRIAAEDAMQPSVYLFGGGHVGHALAAALSLLPLTVTVVETRADALEGIDAGAKTLLTPMPEEAVRDAPAGAAFVVLTHDHALDFLIVAEALKRYDAAYVGMIGSKTKRATFRSWYLKEAGGSEADLDRLVCPIGGADVKDKRPAVIAALAAAEIMRAVSADGAPFEARFARTSG